MLQSQHDRIAAHMAQVLPLIAREIEGLAIRPDKLTAGQMDELTRTYDVERIYFIDRAYRIFQTNLPSDLDLQFPATGFTKFLDTVYGKDRVMSIGIDLSTKTGALNTYSYFGPRAEDYIIETSTEIARSLAEGDFGWMSRYFFKDLFLDAVTSNEYVKDVDLYLVNDVAAWSLLHAGSVLAPDIVERVASAGRYRVMDPAGKLITIYSIDSSNATADRQSELVKRLVIRKITYDASLAREAAINVLIGSLVVLVLALHPGLLAGLLSAAEAAAEPAVQAGGRRRARSPTAIWSMPWPIPAAGTRSAAWRRASPPCSTTPCAGPSSTSRRPTPRSSVSCRARCSPSPMGKPSIVSVRLGDNRRLTMTVLFSDIRNFTGLSEGMSPDENFAPFINAYLERMGPVIRGHNGFIDKYIGDAIMGLFEQADDALRAGLAMLDTLAAYNGERQAAGLAPIRIGIGINSGSLMLGTIGEKDRMDGTVISDAVNLASRVESLTKSYDVGFLISQNTYGQLSGREARDIRPIDVVVVKGKTQPVTIFEVFERNDPAERATSAEPGISCWRASRRCRVATASSGISSTRVRGALLSRRPGGEQPAEALPVSGSRCGGDGSCNSGDNDLAAA